MRILILFVVSVGLGSGGWVWFASGPHLTERAQRLATAADEEIGIRRMLAKRGELVLADLVIGSMREAGLKDFRARVNQSGRWRPVFGQARRLCVKDFGKSDCWQIVKLQIDGKETPPDDTHVEKIPIPLQPLIDTLETADVPTDKAAGPRKSKTSASQHPTEAHRTAKVAKPHDQPTKIDAAASHTVARPVINVRAGPSVQHAILMKLEAGSRLQLLEQSADWGRFRVLDGPGRGTEVWAALRILSQNDSGKKP